MVAVVTGASAGIGRAIALRLGEAGYRVGLVARDAAALEDVRREIESAGSQAFVAPADVADAEALFRAADEIARAFGRIDLWVNDAMETVFSFFEDMSPHEFRRVTEVTYLGFVHGTMAALRHMRDRDDGTIVQIGSALGYRGIPLQSAYCGAKHGIKGFTESLRTELLHRQSGIRLVTVDLPAVNTPQFDWARAHTAREPRPMGRPIEPEVVADAVLRAIHGRGREYWLGGTTILAIVGNMVAPAFMDHYLAAKAVEGQMRQERVAADRRDDLDAPVHDLHRTRGSFSNGAANSAVLVPAGLTRIGIIAAGAAAFFALGMASAARRRRSGREQVRRLPERGAFRGSPAQDLRTTAAIRRERAHSPAE